MTLDEIKQLVSQERYHYSSKVRECIEEGFFSEVDLEHCILSADRVYKQQRDELKQSVDKRKYVIAGRDTHGQPFYTVGKVMPGVQGRVYFFITAHQAEETT